jgi:hypothetical protein
MSDPPASASHRASEPALRRPVHAHPGGPGCLALEPPVAGTDPLLASRLRHGAHALHWLLWRSHVASRMAEVRQAAGVARAGLGRSRTWVRDDSAAAARVSVERSLRGLHPVDARGLPQAADPATATVRFREFPAGRRPAPGSFRRDAPAGACCAARRHRAFHASCRASAGRVDLVMGEAGDA